MQLQLVSTQRRHERRARFIDYHRSGNPDLRDRLVRRHLPLARRLAARYARRGVPAEDLFQVASIGLIHAVDRYDPRRGIAFDVFATPTILGEIKHHFRDRSWDLRVPRRVQDRYLAI
ncbi:MAG TPA: sigma-70 family RNA polymerase sigma factor, partial [Acidimicrobiales bacterium]|nr:sigma-70 family RNA polymerase sigma factor [Acidimicrobiales bacterium]